MKEQKIQDPGNLPHQKILHPLKSAAFAVTGSSVQRYYLIVLEREHYCCWSIHSGGEQSLGETKYIIGNSYTVGKVWASTFGIN